MLNRLFRKSHLFVKNSNLNYQRYFIKKEKLEHRLSIIWGARGIGKTTTIAQSYYKQNEALYVSLDDINNAKESIYEIAKARILAMAVAP
jgi:DNA transposition AAA+ family ATPase